MSLGLVLVSCRQCISVSYFWIHSASLHLLVGIFNLFMFKVINNKYVCSTVSSLELFRSQRYYDFQPLTCVVFGFKVKNSLEDSMVLAQKQKYRPMEQDRKPRNKPIHLWVPGNNLFLTKEARIYNVAKTASSINGAGKTGQLHVKE